MIFSALFWTFYLVIFAMETVFMTFYDWKIRKLAMKVHWFCFCVCADVSSHWEVSRSFWRWRWERESDWICRLSLRTALRWCETCGPPLLPPRPSSSSSSSSSRREDAEVAGYEKHTHTNRRLSAWVSSHCGFTEALTLQWWCHSESDLAINWLAGSVRLSDPFLLPCSLSVSVSSLKPFLLPHSSLSHTFLLSG